MAGSYDATVTAFYVAYYGRPADPAGLAYWSQALEQSKGDFSAIVKAFSSSAEATTRFGNTSAADRITDIYQQLFNRAPDKAGLDYWLDAIQKGNATLGDIAIQVVNGAQSSDLQLSNLRQDAASQFTAAVKASGVAYDGNAAVEAARVLIAAVKNDTSADSVKSLVNASTALVQTAHDNPAILATLAANGKLSALLGTSSGQADPLGAINALTSIAKAAAADPAALAALQQNGGIVGLLNSLPPGISLADLKTAVDTGGLGTAVAIVAPPLDTTPPAAPTVQLAVDTGFNTTDHISANGKILVSGLEAGSTWQYSSDSGKTWSAGAAAVNGAASLDTSGIGQHTLQVRSIDDAGNVGAATSFSYDIEPTIAFTSGTNSGKDLASDTLLVNSYWYFVNIAGKAAGKQPVFQVSDTGAADSWVTTSEDQQLADGTHYIRYLVPDAGGVTTASNALKLVTDSKMLSPTVQLVEDTGFSSSDKITSNGKVKVSGLSSTESFSYSTDNGKTWTTGKAPDANGAAVIDNGASGAQTVLVRTLDKVGGVNAFTSTSFSYTVQTAIVPTMKFAGTDGKDLNVDTLYANSTNYVVNVYGSKTAISNVFQVSDTGKDGEWITTSDSAKLADGLHYIRYVFTDAAGNTGTTNALKLVMDTVAPAQGLKLASVQGADAGSNHTDLAKADVVFSYTGTLDLDNAEALFYLVGNAVNWSRADNTVLDTVNKTLTLKGIDLSKGDVQIHLEAKDAANNITHLDQTISGPYTTFTATASDKGIVLNADKAGKVFLTDGSAPVQVQTDATDGGILAKTSTTAGIQTTAVHGLLGVGPNPELHYDHAGVSYALGTTGADTLSGQYVWGYDGDDTIVALGTAANVQNQVSMIYGGNGADTIEAKLGNSTFVYRGAAESHIVDGTVGAAHGFDTITVNDQGPLTHAQVFDFGVKISGFYTPSITASGNETGNELLALINDMFHPQAQLIEAAYVNAGANLNYLVVDADGNGTIDGQDFIVKIVGAVDLAHSTNDGTTGFMTLMSA